MTFPKFSKLLVVLAAMCSLSAASVVEYTFTTQWLDLPVINGQPTLYQTGFNYTSNGFYAGGTLNCPITGSPSPGLACGSIPFDWNDFAPWYTEFVGASLSQSASGVNAADLFAYLQFGPEGMIIPNSWTIEPPNIEVFFPGAALDVFGSWTVPVDASNGALNAGTATLTVSSGAPEPTPLALVVFGFAALWPLRRQLVRGAGASR